MHRIGSSFERLAKTGVRSAERQGKSVAVQVQGEQICVPKGPLDELWSTLAHLVRNAVAHGIEPAHERVAAGKTQEGNIILCAQVDESTLKLSVSDDGRGIDWQALARKVAADGGEPANDNHVELLFREGASTAELSDLAGRGVGMSAVRQAVLAVGGTIDVTSRPGHGTTFEIAVPVGKDVYVPAPELPLVMPYRSRNPPRISVAAG
ncbi:MAG: hypothetical protein RL701_3695 [Pseudomonadota bacterium]